MMKHVFAATALCLAMSTAALAGPADDAIKARQACMKANGAAMGVFVPVLKGEKPFDAAAHKAATDAIEAACGGWAGWWGADTQKGESAETWAKPEVWSDAAGFEAASKGYMTALTAVKAATDDATFKAAFGGFGESCKGCHEKFRRPKE
jgi:cytochrome c556